MNLKIRHRGRPKGCKPEGNLKPEDIQAMRDMAAEGWGWGAIAKKFGVGHLHASMICRGKRRADDRP